MHSLQGSVCASESGKKSFGVRTASCLQTIVLRLLSCSNELFGVRYVCQQSVFLVGFLVYNLCSLCLIELIAFNRHNLSVILWQVHSQIQEVRICGQVILLWLCCFLLALLVEEMSLKFVSLHWFCVARWSPERSIFNSTFEGIIVTVVLN